MRWLLSIISKWVQMFRAYYAGIGQQCCPPADEVSVNRHPPQIPAMTGEEPSGQTWLYPMPTFTDTAGKFGPAGQGYNPQVSDGFKPFAIATGPKKRRKHLGVDIDYKRIRGHRLERNDLPESTKLFFVPSNVIPVLAAADGFLWNAKKTRKGHSVQIDHGNRMGGLFNTFYQHMSRLFVPFTRGGRVRGTNRRFFIRKGQLLGITGFNPTGFKFNHLHFELWNPTQDKAIDPEKILTSAEIINPSDPRITEPSGRVPLVATGAPSIPIAERSLSVLAIPAGLALAAAALVGETPADREYARAGINVGGKRTI